MRLRSIALPGLFFLATIHFAGAAPQAPGTIEDVFCPSKGESVILYIVPEGAHVTKGQLLSLLDPRGSRASVEHQQISTRQAEAAYSQSRLTREVAEIAVLEYEEGTYKQQLATIDGDIALAEADLQRSRDRLEWAKKMAEKKYVSQGQVTSDEQTLQKARFAVEQHKTHKKVLVEYTRSKTLKELRAEVEKARSEELSRKATHELEKAKEEGLRRQVRNVQILSPMNGSVQHARPTRLVEEGAEVCEGQLILRIVPDAKATPAKP
jgi:HlyD family secretion protein